jgi:murein DD-endopeptidase MepM/ murein hydrolase activator NlpD
MTMLVRRVAAFVACGLLLVALASREGASVAGQGESGNRLEVRVSTKARAMQPGEVVLITAHASRPSDRVSGRVPAGPVHFFRTADPLVWQALMGLDVKTKAGPLPLTVTVDAGGATAKTTSTLTVLPKRFDERRITVDERFQRPPAGELARIEREAKLLSSVIAGVSPERLWNGPFQMPVPGGPTSAFGRVSIVNGERRSPHAGIDLKAGVGTPVRAPAGGRIVLSAPLHYAGDAVIIDHGLGAFSLLVHLSVRHAAEGDMVKAGDVVGLSGATGRITGPHLHWGVRIAGALVDPLSLVAATRGVRP